jgi:hypothetical protein
MFRRRWIASYILSEVLTHGAQAISILKVLVDNRFWIEGRQIIKLF